MDDAAPTVYRWDDIPDIVSPDLRRKVISGDRVMITRALRARGCVVEGHQHENEQLTYVVEGKLQFWLGPHDERQVVVSAGEVLHVPANVPHRALALEDTLELDIFSPPRADFTR
jgi:quercetin dioxygenase-like cupin family protein